MTPGIVKLSRTEVAHVAAVVDVLITRHDGSPRKAAEGLGICLGAIIKFRRRPASIRVLRRTLTAIARGAGAEVTVDELVAGRVHLVAAPSARRARPSVVVRR